MSRVLAPGLVLLGLLLLAPAALGSMGHENETSMPMVSPSPSAADVARGKELFTGMGCAACHGPNAEGTAIAPAMPGHTADAVRRQVRTPRGTMPAFSTARLSDTDLDKIAAYIVSLAPAGAEHGHAFEITVPVHHHLLLALNALKAENEKDALHHLDHALLVAKGEEKEAVEKMRANVVAGKHHDAEHDLEEETTKSPGASLTYVQLHADLALYSLNRKNTTDADHHIAHALEKASASEKATLEDARDHLKKGETSEAKEKLETLARAAPATPTPAVSPTPAATPTVAKPPTRTPGFEAVAALGALFATAVLLRRRP